MTGYLDVVSGPASAWVQTLWRATWQGSLFIAGVWLVCRAVPKLPPSVRCWLWWVACLRLVAALAPLPAVALPVLPADRPSVSAPTSSIGNPLAAAGTLRDASTGSTPVVPQERAYLPELLAAAWLAGGLYCFASLLRQGRGLSKLLRASRPTPESRAACEARRLGVAMGLRQAPVVRESPTITAPVVAGPVRPVLLLPPGFADRLTHQELRMAVAHELAHVCRGDLALAYLPALVHSLFYFLPSAWLAVSEWSTAREAACDARAISATGAQPPEYCELLVKIVSLDHRPTLAPALGATAAYHTLKGRISMMKHYRSTPGRAARVVAAGLLTAAMLSVAPWRLAPRAEAAPQGTKVSLNTENAPLADVLRELFRQAGAEYRIDGEAAETGRVTVSLSDVPFRTALESVLRSTRTTNPLAYRVENGVFVIVRAPAAIARPEERGASLSLTHVRIGDAAASLGRALGVQIAVSPRVRGLVTVSFKDLRAGEAVSRLVRSMDSRTPITYLRIQDDRYVILPMTDPQVQSRLVRQPVSASYRNMDIRYALKSLFASVGTNYTLDQAVSGTVTLSLRAVPFQAALERVLRAGATPLAWRWEDGVYLIMPRGQP